MLLIRWTAHTSPFEVCLVTGNPLCDVFRMTFRSSATRMRSCRGQPVSDLVSKCFIKPDTWGACNQPRSACCAPIRATLW